MGFSLENRCHPNAKPRVWTLSYPYVDRLMKFKLSQVRKKLLLWFWKLFVQVSQFSAAPLSSASPHKSFLSQKQNENLEDYLHGSKKSTSPSKSQGLSTRGSTKKAHHRVISCQVRLSHVQHACRSRGHDAPSRTTTTRQHQWMYLTKNTGLVTTRFQWCVSSCASKQAQATFCEDFNSLHCQIR